jgi:hypothetical protein
MEVAMFSERIRRRNTLFWKTRRLGFHGKGRCLLTYLDRNDPIETWHCCDLWQRKLANKSNSREFAVKHGCRVPELYWSGQNLDEVPFASLPDRYVLRPNVGHSKKGVFVMENGVNLLDGKTYSRQQLIAELRRGLKPLTRRRVLVESFVQPEGGSIPRPIEFQAYTFGSKIAAIQRVERFLSPENKWRFEVRVMDENWESIPPLHIMTHPPNLPPVPPPECFEEMKSWARTLGQAYGTFVRIDMYASNVGCVFGEFAATPLGGSQFTEFGNQYLEDLWEETFPGRI